jgi:hypothetical protein
MHGSENFAAKLRAFDEALRNRFLNNAARKSAKPAIDEIREGLRSGIKKRNTGLSVRSIGLVVRNYRSSGIVFVAVGARKSVIGTDKRGRKVWPIKYLHLIDLPVKGQGRYEARRRGTKTTIRRGRGATPGLGVIARVRAGYHRKWQEGVLRNIGEEVDKWFGKTFGE